MEELPRSRENGIGAGWAIILVVLVGILGGLIWKVTRNLGPSIQLHSQLRGIGQNTPIAIVVQDERYRIKHVKVELRQGQRVFQILDSAPPRSSWWRVWSRAGTHTANFDPRVGRKAFPELTEGRATLEMVATNDSWGRLFRGGRTELRLDLPVRFAPPQVSVLTSQHYINQGGCDMVLFKVSPGTAESGVQVGDYFFPSWPVKESMADTRMCLFAYPYNVDPSTPARIVARDDAGNETVSNFVYRVFPKQFHTDTIQLKDDFMARVVPAIMSQTPELRDQGSLLKNFLLVNGPLRATNARELVAFAQKTANHLLWTQPFIQLGNSKVEAAFADYRTYVYDGETVDHQTHLGFDLAVVEHNPVVAANDGVVVHAGFFGIYGNTVILDHGCGLQSLYAHLSSMDVKPGIRFTRRLELEGVGRA